VLCSGFLLRGWLVRVSGDRAVTIVRFGTGAGSGEVEFPAA